MCGKVYFVYALHFRFVFYLVYDNDNNQRPTTNDQRPLTTACELSPTFSLGLPLWVGRIARLCPLFAVSDGRST
jgi:hypothetical protein